jgi:peroxiredoxin
MSYTRNFPCNYCTKKETCSDYKDIETAICKIHEKTYEQGHQGSGSVTIECLRMDSTYK